jgi:hypothetical protein
VTSSASNAVAPLTTILNARLARGVSNRDRANSFPGDHVLRTLTHGITSRLPEAVFQRASDLTDTLIRAIIGTG